MGVAEASRPKRDVFQRRDRAVTATAYAAGTAAAAAAAAITIALVAYGWRQVGWVLVAPGAQGVMGPLAMTGRIVLIALPITLVVAIFAAACASDASIGGATSKALRASFEWSSGIPPVVIGAALFFSSVMLRNQAAIQSAVAALVLLNVPKVTARLAHAFEAVPCHAREAAAALGASPVASFVGLSLPSAGWAVAATLLMLTGQMIGETSAIAVAVSASSGPQPLSVQIWRFASNASLAGTEAAAGIVLASLVGALGSLSRLCARRQTDAMSTSL